MPIPALSGNVTPLKVLEDSRCPANARCVWSGQVRLRVRLNYRSGVRKIEMTLGKPVALGPAGTLTLAEVSPDKLTTHNDGGIARASYRFGFRYVGAMTGAH